MTAGAVKDFFFRFVLSCIDKRTKKGGDRGSEVGTVHKREDGEGPVPLRKPREIGKRESWVMISSPGGVAGVPIFAVTWGGGQDTSAKVSVRPSSQSVIGESSMTSDPIEAHNHKSTKDFCTNVSPPHHDDAVPALPREKGRNSGTNSARGTKILSPPNRL